MYKYLQPYQLYIQHLVLSYLKWIWISWPNLGFFLLLCDLNKKNNWKPITTLISRLPQAKQLLNIGPEHITIYHNYTFNDITITSSQIFIWKLSRNRFQGFNTGVVLYNLAAMRESSVYNRSRSWILSFQRNGSLLFPTEQNHFILNIWFLYVLPNTVIWTLGQ